MDILNQQKAFFSTGKTKDVVFRKKALRRLYDAIVTHEDSIADAVYADFKKPRFETLVAETQFVLADIKTLLKNLSMWATPERAPSVLANFPSKSYIYREPYGQVLVIAPWNYPVQLTFAPLAGAVAAGNTVVVKPSELTSNTSRLIAKIVAEVFDPGHVTVVEGGVEVSKELLEQRWDYIFFTGSTQVGRIVYQKAANHLTPVTLELGGKSPCVVDASANIGLAAKRIVWGKFLNSGQTCIAPDYVVVHHQVKEQLLKELGSNILKSYGSEASPDLARIVNKRHFSRLASLLKGQDIVFGGQVNEEDHFLGPTLVDAPALDSPLMQEEIFGPILPVLTYRDELELEAIIGTYDKPLATYLFTKSRSFQKRFMEKYGFGGGAINDTLVHIANHYLPFGGVGPSGIGAYHGKASFELFSHKKGIVKRGTWLDPALRYAPYKLPMKIAKWVKHMF